MDDNSSVFRTKDRRRLKTLYIKSLISQFCLLFFWPKPLPYSYWENGAKLSTIVANASLVLAIVSQEAMILILTSIPALLFFSSITLTTSCSIGVSMYVFSA